MVIGNFIPDVIRTTLIRTILSPLIRHFAHIKAGQTAVGKPIPDFDIAIAATALAGDLVVVSADRHIAEIPGVEIAEIPGVEVEDWTSTDSGL